MTHTPEAPRRGALTLVLGGGLLFLCAWTLAVVSTYSESTDYCPSWLGRGVLDRGSDEGFCATYLDERGRLVLLLAVIGILLVVAGVVRRRAALIQRSPHLGALSLVVFASRQNRRLLTPPAGVAGLVLLGSAAAMLIAMVPESLSGGWGLGSDQSPWRFATWIGTAVLLPWVVHAVWSVHHRAISEPGSPDPQSVLA